MAVPLRGLQRLAFGGDRNIYPYESGGRPRVSKNLWDMDLDGFGRRQQTLRKGSGVVFENLVAEWMGRLDGREGVPNSPRAADYMSRLLQYAQSLDPQRYARVARENGWPGGDGQQPGEELSVEDFLAGLADAFASSGQSARVTAINRQISQMVRGTERLTTDTTRTETRFVDVPTPEEFLNDFEVGLTTHVQGLSRAGQLDPLTQDFIMQNQQFFFDRYITELSARARAGQQIFKVVGLGVLPASNIKLGTRAGPTTTQRQHGRVTGTETMTSKERETQSLEGGGTQPFSVDETTTTQTDKTFDNMTTERIRENIIQRPNLTTVFKMSPLQFLQMNYGENEFRQFYQGTKGQKQRMAEVAGGGPVSRARRVV